MNIPNFSIKNYQFTITLFVFLLALGLSSFFNMPQSEDPVLDIPAAMVISIYPGALPKDIESQVVDPIEEALNELEIQNDITIYEGVDHAFANPSGSRFAPEETKDAWVKTLAFFEENLE